MREVKPVDVRKKEILEAAVKVFKEKGYDKTSIADISRALNISQGLCYRYFKSKEEIFDSAIDAYAQYIAEQMIAILSSDLSILEIMNHLPDFTGIEKKSVYFELFHSKESNSFHDRLSLQICRKVVPYVKKRLEQEVEKGVIQVEDTDTMAKFIVFGQLGILLDSDIPAEEKNKRVIRFILNMLELLR